MSTEIRPIDQYNQYLSKTDVIPTIDVSVLTSLAERARVITVSDVTNEAEMHVAKAMRLELSKARIEIAKVTKLMRDEHTEINRGIREVELALLAEFEGEEDRLKGYEDELKAKRLKDERMMVLPMRKERLEAIGADVADDVLLAMDDLTFSNFLADKQTEIIMEKKRKEDEEARIEAAKKEAAEAATREAERKAKEEADEKEREHQAEIKRLEDEKRAKEEAAEAAKKEEARVAKQKKYQKFLADNDYNETDFITKDEGDTVVLYKKVAVYTK